MKNHATTFLLISFTVLLIGFITFVVTKLNSPLLNESSEQSTSSVITDNEIEGMKFSVTISANTPREDNVYICLGNSNKYKLEPDF
ncbi:hypothetical protein H6764_03210 [Candidatus Nomurabacteria bacterium]|nr:hypothetical protein [Candidatus Nomurabacteria bacterium]